MNAVVHHRLVRDSEVECASELARRVFDEVVARDYSIEGREEFHRYSSATAWRERHRIGCITLAAERDGRLVGILHLKDWEHISMLFVEGASQRQGIGRALIEAATEWALARQPPARVLTVASTPNAIEAYRRMGFVPTGDEQVLNGIRFVPMKREVVVATH